MASSFIGFGPIPLFQLVMLLEYELNIFNGSVSVQDTLLENIKRKLNIWNLGHSVTRL